VRVQAVLFDVGNTLAHLDYGFLAAQARRFRPGVTADEVGRADALTRREGWPAAPDWFAGYFGATAARLGLGPEDALAFAAAARAEHRRRPSGLWNQVDPDAVATLHSLAARGLRLGVVSNADGRVEDQLRGFGLRGHFEVVVDSQLAGVAKPDPGIFRAALDAMGVSAAAALYVGDIPEVDVAGARAAGMAALLYDRWDVHSDGLGPRLLRLSELPALLDAARR
jgi:HAD superfamily hydrolase (TIGR01509 family)